MSTITLELEDDLVALLRQLKEPVQESVKDVLVMELYRRGAISGGRGTELLGMTRLEFIQHAGRLGIPYFNFSDEELAAEIAASRQL
jgi:predicted HTH domain antitoxin